MSESMCDYDASLIRIIHPLNRAGTAAMAKTANPDQIRLIRPIIANGKTKLTRIDTRSTCGFKGDKAEIGRAHV